MLKITIEIDSSNVDGSTERDHQRRHVTMTEVHEFQMIDSGAMNELREAERIREFLKTVSL